MPPLTLLLTADCCNGPYPEHADRGRWAAIFARAALLERTMVGLTGGAARVTWFVRADNQIGTTLGDPLALLHEYLPLLMGFEEAGHEIGFHPHCYKLNADGWTHESDDPRNAAMLLHVARALSMVPLTLRAARIGEVHMTPLLMAVLREQGFEADCTAMPGRVRTNPPTYDWSRAPRLPYRPNVEDPQRESADSTDHLWELPFSMVPLTGPDESVPKERYLNLSFKPGLLRPALEAWLPDQNYVSAIVHPVELLPVSPETASRFPLLSFSLDAVSENLGALLAIAKSHGREVRFVTAGRYAAELGKSS